VSPIRKSYQDPAHGYHISNLYKFILIEEKIDPEIKFNKIETRTSPVYDYCLGRDPYEIASRHICLPIWFNQDTSMTQKVIEEINSCSH